MKWKPLKEIGYISSQLCFTNLWYMQSFVGWTLSLQELGTMLISSDVDLWCIAITWCMMCLIVLFISYVIKQIVLHFDSLSYYHSISDVVPSDRNQLLIHPCNLKRISNVTLYLTFGYRLILFFFSCLGIPRLVLIFYCCSFIDRPVLTESTLGLLGPEIKLTITVSPNSRTN